MKMNPLLKLVLEMGPLAVFFLTNASKGIFIGTAAFMAATVIALTVSYIICRTIPLMPLVTAVFVVVFGGLTLWLANDLFIKIKPTIVNLLFAAILFIGLKTNRLFIKLVLDGAIHLTDRGWVIMTRAWAGFFVALAVVNEIVWRNTDTDTWVNFKVFGILPLTLLFSVSMVPLIMRYTVQPTDDAKPKVDTP
jgi:intracellular septation protein